MAIIGAGGIGFDVGEFLTHAHDDKSEAERFNDEWGIDPGYTNRGGLKAPVSEEAPRRVFLLQRKSSKVGEGWPRPPAGFAVPCSRSAACR